MKTIWKFKLMPVSELNLPEGAEFLHVDTQKGVPCIWYLVDPSKPIEVKVLKIFGTGFNIEDNEEIKHLGTFLMQGDLLVWHVFETKTKKKSGRMFRQEPS